MRFRGFSPPKWGSALIAISAIVLISFQISAAAVPEIPDQTVVKAVCASPGCTAEFQLMAKEVSSFDLQATLTVPPLISAEVTVNIGIGVAKTDQNSLMTQIATMEGFASKDIVATSAMSLNLMIQQTASIALREPPMVQLKRPMCGNHATANNDPYEKESTKTAASAKTDLTMNYGTQFANPVVT